MSKRILLVEDDPAAVRITSYALEQAGYEVVVAMDGVDGLRKAQDEKPDLLILDVMLPWMDGFAICQYLRSKPGTGRMPILMISAKARDMDRSTGFRVGTDDYIAKPIRPSEVLSRVERLLASKTVESK